MDDGRRNLLNQYNKITKISEESVLSTYLLGNPINKSMVKDAPIYPFGLNLSQKQAVKTALGNSISIIEGPPGTGKTQTILNIISNLVLKGKTVAVVSNNNSATANVQEKLDKNGYGFITALLGNSNKKSNFFEKMQVDISNIEEWEQNSKQILEISEQINKISIELDKLLEERNEIAKLQEEISKIELEQSYFEGNFKGEFIPISRFSFFRKWSQDLILNFIYRFEQVAIEKHSRRLTIRAFFVIKYGVYKFKLINDKQDDIISSIKIRYYQNGIEVRQKLISLKKAKLTNKNYEKLMEQYNVLSSKLFKAALYKRYSHRKRINYSAKSFKHRFKDFIWDYPVILSTTHSIMTCIPENYLFDYLIIDEASQVDLVTASLATRA